MRLSGDVGDFLDNTYPFKERICSLFDTWGGARKCYPGDFQSVTAQAGSTLVNFTINFYHGGPTVAFMRNQLDQPELVQAALGNQFTLLAPFDWTTTEDTLNFKNDELKLNLGLVKTAILTPFVLILLGMWGLVVFWTITSRGEACRKRAHSEWREAIVPSAETLQVLVLSSFVQLILGLSLNYGINRDGNASLGLIVFFGLGIGGVGTLFTAVLNAWIRGESASLFKALDYDQIDKMVNGWTDDDEEAGLIGREYRQVYEAGGNRRLGQLAAHDWESSHLKMEKQMGLFDLSDNVFDEMKPEKDPNLLAAFLNSTLLSAFGGKKKGADNDGNMPAAPPSELRVMSVEVPGGLPKWRLRDVMLQWRLRHTAHSRELDAVDWLLGQLDPAGFELLSVKVPEQARLLLLEAMIQYTQKYAELQLDACHATRVQAVLQQLSPRFHGASMELPDDGEGTNKIRELVLAALTARINGSSKGVDKRDITQEEGWMLQQAAHSLSPEFGLISMSYSKSDPEEMKGELKDEIDKRAESIRAQSQEYMYDDEIYSQVPIVSREKPPDLIEDISAGHGPKRRRNVDIHGSHVKSSAPPRKLASPTRTPTRKDLAALLPTSDQPLPMDPLSMAATDHLADVQAEAPAPAAADPPVDVPAEAPAVAQPPAAAPEPTTVSAPATAPIMAVPPSPAPSPPSNLERSLSQGSSATVKRQGSSRVSFAGDSMQSPMTPQSEKSAIKKSISWGGADELSSRNKASVSRNVVAWWRHRRKKDSADHDKMPCWKQYFMLFLGSVGVGASTITVVTIGALTDPLEQYFVLLMFGISMPVSLILHQLGRWGILYARHHLALRRGRSVEGFLSRKDIKKQRRQQRRQRRDDLSEQSMDIKGINPELVASPAEPLAKLSRNMQSAHLASALHDAAPSLASRNSELAVKSVLTRSSSSLPPGVSTFLDPKPPESSNVGASTTESDALSQSASTPTFKPGQGGLQRKSSSAFVRGAALLGKKDDLPPSVLRTQRTRKGSLALPPVAETSGKKEADLPSTTQVL